MTVASISPQILEQEMKVNFQFEAQLRQIAGVSQTELELESGAGLRAALDRLTSTGFDELRSRIFDDNGDLQSTILLFVNDEAIPTEMAESTTLQENSTVLVLPPISGG